jgi:hypothetical protein
MYIYWIATSEVQIQKNVFIIILIFTGDAVIVRKIK